MNGFDAKTKAALDLATTWGYASNRAGFDPSGLDYKKIASLAGVEYKVPEASKGRIKAESLDLFPDSNLDDKTIVSFTIHFKPNQTEFSTDQYGSEFKRAIETSSTFGNAVIVIRGHTDPTKTLVDMIRAGMAKGIIKRQGAAGNYSYTVNGKPLDLEATSTVVALIKAGQFDGTRPNPRETMQAGLNLSLARANSVKKEIVAYAQSLKVNLDESQIQPVGAGINEPFIAKPKNIAEAEKNMRVEFRIIRVPAESIEPSDFDF